ncbi:right-handed parallel beta-helix repeat-containing protein [Pseudoduganella namucuonensis]|uniref:Right handed beta helix region n=1 Tax=Pseudoduganella namucuonensis TaxID=1035707 RepID=A0A1I7GF17_9BURK|nr:right-handed parallel beta-helix repeat-containing protein [Pseudoduganella namucuonensis]SFU46921.1 Right handed beta helix region [Pseudoduganella namucuonensis]
MGARRWLVSGAVVAAALGAAGLGGAAYVLQSEGIAPRTLAPYLEHRAAGHNGVIVGAAAWGGAKLMEMDRGPALPRAALATVAGAGARAVPARPGGQETLVAGAEQLRAAVAAAQPGAVLTLLPGTYRISGRPLKTGRGGTAAAPITLRAASPGTVRLESDTVEAFQISEPHWRLENLTIRGVCQRDDDCEHALHVIGGASHFVARNNTISDFNAHIKINGHGGRFPDHGLLENNTLTNARERNTGKPVTPVDLVAASHWILRGNLITDFIKAGGDRVSYGAFAKGGGAHNVFERNIVICEHLLQRRPGQRVGLSLGGGGTGKMFCRDQRCVAEQEQGVIRDNLIASCSDEGLYLNSAAASKISHNTLLDTSGVLVRFPASSADLDGNLVDGAIRGRNGGDARLHDNLAGGVLSQYLGRHPLRQLYREPAALDFGWREAAPRRAGAETGEARPDLCGAARPAQPRYGAFEDFAACLAPAAASL